MGLYNALFGYNPEATEYLQALDLRESDIPRYRDVYITEFNGEKAIGVYTRMGGGNRGHDRGGWAEMENVVGPPGPDCPCSGCRAEFGLTVHPLYLGDQDAEHDSTYATYFFRLPEGMDPDQAQLDKTPAEKSDELMDVLTTKDESNHLYGNAMEVGANIMSAFSRSGTVIVDGDGTVTEG